MACFKSLCFPPSSRQTMPISSVTLAWRTLVVTGNFFASSQITGVVISLGGYISHSLIWAAAAGAFLVFAFFVMCIVLLCRRLAPGDGGNDADFVAVLQRRVL